MTRSVNEMRESIVKLHAWIEEERLDLEAASVDHYELATAAHWLKQAKACVGGALATIKAQEEGTP